MKWQENQLSEDATQAIEEVKSVKADAITNCIKQQEINYHSIFRL